MLLTAAAPSRRDDARRDAAHAAARAAEAAHAAEVARDAAAARAAQATQAAAALIAERTKATARLRQAEAATLQAANRMADLARDQQDAETRLNARAAAIGPLLPLIERLSLYPAETLLAVPESPEDAIRGLLVLKGMTHRLEAEAAALRREQAAYATARAATAAEAPRLAGAEHAQREAALVLDRELAAADLGRRAALSDSSADAKRATELAARADSLRALMTSLEAARPVPRKRGLKQPHSPKAAPVAPEESPVAVSSGALLVPVVGTVVRGWGAPTDAGPSVGISYRAAPNARVLAPCAGRVAFAAPFHGYGHLLILDCGGGTDAVLAGLATFAVRVGQSVHRGEEVGAMPNWDPAAKGDRPTLYVELRRRGEPVDPAGLLKTS